MKKRISAFVCLLIIMAVLPLAVVRMSANDKKEAVSVPTADSAENKEESICAYAFGMCSADFCDEAIKAALITSNTNYLASKSEFEKINTDYNSDTELYNRIKADYNSVRELYLAYNGKAEYIPYSISSNGNTVKSDKYDHIVPVASPWDRFSEGFDPNSSCEGVSLYGINFLCGNGSSAEEALKWYLPDFKIKKL